MLNATQWNTLTRLCNKHGENEVLTEYLELRKTHPVDCALVEIKRKFGGV
jgi:hypothetical protein